MIKRSLSKAELSFIIPTIIFFLLLVKLAPQPTMHKVESPAFTGQLIMLRGLSGPFHTLLADRYWLLSSSLHESSSVDAQKESSEPFFQIMNTIATLDPDYISSLRYGSTYLASIYRKPDQAHKLIDTALDYSSDYADLYLLKISQELGYQYPPRYELLNQWIAEFGKIEGDIPDWLGGSLLYAKQRELRRDLQIDDLEYLLEHATNDIERQAIQERISQL